MCDAAIAEHQNSPVVTLPVCVAAKAAAEVDDISAGSTTDLAKPLAMHPAKRKNNEKKDRNPRINPRLSGILPRRRCHIIRRRPHDIRARNPYQTRIMHHDAQIPHESRLPGQRGEVDVGVLRAYCRAGDVAVLAGQVAELAGLRQRGVARGRLAAEVGV